MTDDEQFKEWGEQIWTIYDHITIADLSRHIHNEVGAILHANPRLWRNNNSFYLWMATTYEAYALVAVRRQVDRRKGSISLVRLLDEISRYPHILSRERFVQQAIASKLPASEGAMNRMFDHYTAPGANHIQADVVRAELRDLQAQTKSIEEYTNTRVAHFNPKVPEETPMVLQVHAALDHLYALVEKYLLLLRAVKYEKPQLADEETWKDVFREPWILRLRSWRPSKCHR
jgi:hypothetical protein